MAAHPIDSLLAELLASKGVDASAITWMRDWTGKIPEIHSQKLLWLVDSRSGRSFIAAKFREENWFQLNSPDYAATNHGLNVPALTEQAGVLRLVRVLTALLYDPRFVLCDKRLGSRSEAILSTYIAGRSATTAQLRALCQDDPLIRVDGRSWSADFRIMDYTGAIRQLKLAGGNNPVTVDALNHSEIAPPNTFFFADEF